MRFAVATSPTARIDKKENGLWLRRDFYVQGNQLQMKGWVVVNGTKVSYVLPARIL